jgi:hypothetical protein
MSVRVSLAAVATVLGGTVFVVSCATRRVIDPVGSRWAERRAIHDQRRSMRSVIVAAVGVVVSLGFLVQPVAAAGCAADSVESGTVCIDKYEASVWRVPPTATSLIARIRNGTVSLANLTSAAGVIQLGLFFGDLQANGCPPTGNGCLDFYAVSIPGVTPSRYINWFQAAAAARNSGRRLPTNQEWQVAALGTPDPGSDDGSTTCVTHSLTNAPAATGSRSNCVSDVGAFDMVANLWEWVAEWGDQNNGCTTWSVSPDFGSDLSCVGGPGADVLSNLPAALVRGGDYAIELNAGVFAVAATVPYLLDKTIGFRCAR